MALATIGDVALALGVPTPEPESLTARQWERWLSWAEAQIVRRWPLDVLDVDAVVYVEAEAVAAKAARPDAATTIDVQVDDSRMSKRYEKSSGQVTILDEWWDMLAPIGDGQTFGAFPVQPVFEP